MRLLAFALIVIPGLVCVVEFRRPVPQAPTEITEFWIGVASAGFIIALGLVQWMVQRR